jgi:thioredoxin-dependent peroxiredoxin
MTHSLELGAPIPHFSAVTDSGATINSATMKDTLIVLYFYPKDDTSGCTQEACDFRDNMARITAVGATLIGVSPDSIKSHEKFKSKHELPFQLISDESKELCQSFGVWVEKSMYGRKYMGVERSTFLIGRDGTLLKVWRKVSVPGHVSAVIEAIEAL